MDEGSWSFSEHGLEVRVRRIRGARRRIEDAWAVMFGTPLGTRRVHAFAVFDGLGGELHGDIAAQTASDRLGDALKACRGSEDVLGELNRHVRGTGGFTTAVVALVPTERAHDVDLAHVGDSAAYAWRGGRVALLTPKDSAPDRSLTDYLGNEDLLGHVTRTHLDRQSALVLCTDGMDEVVGAPALEPLLRARPETVEEPLDGAFARVRELGAPDNATVVWVARVE